MRSVPWPSFIVLTEVDRTIEYVKPADAVYFQERSKLAQEPIDSSKE
jgi:hypothetical protein